jgi:ribosomal protein L37AE/L43A
MTIDTRNNCPQCGEPYEHRPTGFPLKICSRCETAARKKIAERAASAKNPLKDI